MICTVRPSLIISTFQQILLGTRAINLCNNICWVYLVGFCTCKMSNTYTNIMIIIIPGFATYVKECLKKAALIFLGAFKLNHSKLLLMLRKLSLKKSFFHFLCCIPLLFNDEIIQLVGKITILRQITVYI